MKIAAFDIGGTALKMGVMTRDGRLLETASSQSMTAMAIISYRQCCRGWRPIRRVKE
jgi:predicted NBD/HSP70 family sugar kinase